jgi:rRNA maturation endonuclease Nob1
MGSVGLLEWIAWEKSRCESCGRLAAPDDAQCAVCGGRIVQDTRSLPKRIADRALRRSYPG